MKGVSPLIATVILIAIVVSIAGLLMSWTGAYTKMTQESVQNKTFETVDCSGALIGVVNIFVINGTVGSASVTVKNNGVVQPLTITNAILYNSTGGNFSAVNLPIRDFNRGDLEIVRFSNVNLPKCSDFSSVVVSTNCAETTAKFSGTPIC